MGADRGNRNSGVVGHIGWMALIGSKPPDNNESEQVVHDPRSPLIRRPVCKTPEASALEGAHVPDGGSAKDRHRVRA